MEKKIELIVTELKNTIAEKYSVRKVCVFGSSAREDRRPESDIDVLVHLALINREIEEDIYDMAYDLELKHDCLIDIIAVDDKGLSGIRGTAPIYENIRSDGTVV